MQIFGSVNARCHPSPGSASVENTGPRNVVNFTSRLIPDGRRTKDDRYFFNTQGEADFANQIVPAMSYEFGIQGKIARGM